MPYDVSSKRNKRKARREINIHQNGFAKAYVSTIADSRRPQDSLSDMTNMEVVQDNVVRPRPPLLRYGTQPELTVLGRGKIRYNGTRSLIWMLQGAAEKATGILTASGAVSDGDTVTIGSVTYTFKTALTPAAYEVLIGGSAAVALDNLKKAINLTGTPDTEYGSGTAIHPTVSATTNTDTDQTVEANTAGAAGNSIATTETGANLAFGSATLTGGLDIHGELYKQTDGGAFNIIDDGGVYDDDAWASSVQSKGKAYIFNSVDNLSYVDLSDDTIHTYTALATPSISSVTKTGMAGTTYTHYYRVSANNDVGESIASVVMSVSSGKVRDAWILNTDYVDVTWGAVSGATSYTVYYGTSANTTNELYTVSGATTFRDDGSLSTNPFKLAPEGNSTQGAVFIWMYVDTKNSQIFGITADNKLYYSAAGTADFSPYNGGGYVGIDEQGDTQLNFVDGFRNGKGDPVITVSARAAAGKGKLYHVSFESLTVGDQVIIYPNVVEANGQAGTYSARATVKARDSLWYPTGQDFKSTGTSQNIMNILTTNNVSQVIEPDVARISLQNLHKACAVENKDRIYFALPVNSTENNEIWYIDLTRKNLWVLRWPIAAKDLWLYEDNDGTTHFCALVDNTILEFTRSSLQTHQDDGAAWNSRVAFQSLVWDEDGLTLGSIRNQFFKFLSPRGEITVNAYGLTRNGVQAAAGTGAFTSSTSPTGIGQWDYSGNYRYGDDPGDIEVFGTSVAVIRLKPKGLLAQLDWEVVATTENTDYILSAVNTKGFALDDLVLKTN